MHVPIEQTEYHSLTPPCYLLQDINPEKLLIRLTKKEKKEKLNTMAYLANPMSK